LKLFPLQSTLLLLLFDNIPQQFISENATLLPEGHVQASSEDATFNPGQNFVDASSPPWCTAQENATRPGHFIDLNFTEPIVLTYVKSSGHTLANNLQEAYKEVTSFDIVRNLLLLAVFG